MKFFPYHHPKKSSHPFSPCWQVGIGCAAQAAWGATIIASPGTETSYIWCGWASLCVVCSWKVPWRGSVLWDWIKESIATLQWNYHYSFIWVSKKFGRVTFPQVFFSDSFWSEFSAKEELKERNMLYSPFCTVGTLQGVSVFLGF